MRKVKHIGLTFLILGAIVALMFFRNKIDWIIAAVIVATLLLFVLFIKRLQLVKSMSAIDRMSGHDFERYLGKVFKGLGYSVTMMGLGGGDFGADLVIEKNGTRIAVQAKNYNRKNHVGNDAVQQAIAGATYYDCQEALVVTNSTFTKAAREQASKCNVFPVVLWSGEELKKVINKL